ncbi:MAG TPA: HD domain-containing protein [Desulfuromonadales bacterium]|nr:HD domain-containing protein [Desulfuromonadales bacterium]
MHTAQFNQLTTWFDAYVQPFLETDAEGVKNIQLKIEHTGKVCEAMAQLASGEKLSENQTLIASAVALLHDVGRFPQYQRWRTFRDSESDNHARLAIDVIRQEKLLDKFDPAERLLIEEAIRFHNLLEVPAQFQSASRLYINLIRDADKIDIWRVFTELLAQAPEERASAATLGLPDIPDEVTAACVAALSGGRIVQLDSARTLNDFKLLLISWVYDLSCSTSGRILLERGYIPALAESLPKRDDVTAAVAQAQSALMVLSA